MRRSLSLALLVLAVLLYAGYFSHLTLLRYHAFEARALDMGNLNQAIWNTAHGNWFRLTNQEANLTNRLGYHVEPILLPIALLYRLHPVPEFLLVLQASVVALGALPLFFLARRRALGDWLGLVFGLAYLLNPTLQAANWLEFHPVTLAPTFLMAAFYFLIAGRTGWFAFFAVLAASCKEEIGLLVFMMGLYAWLALQRRRLGLATMVLALGWSLLAVLGIQAVVAGGNIHWSRYAYLGETTGAKLVSLVTRPDLVLAQLQKANVFHYFFQLLLPVGFASLLAPEVLLLALPSLAINLLADFAPMHEVTTLIYAAPVLPFVMLAAVMGIARAREWLATAQTQQAAAGQIHAEYTMQGMTGTAAALVLCGALAGQVLWGYLPGGGNDLALVESEHHRRAQTIFAQIPPDAAVSAQDRLNPHVSGRETVYIFPRVDDASMILLDTTGPAWPQHPSDLRRSVDELLADDFGIAAADDGYLLLQRGAAQKTLPPSFFTAWQAPAEPAPETVATNIRFGDEIALRGYAVATDRYGELVVSLVWEALKPMARDLRFYVGYQDRELQTLHDTRFYPPTAVLWYPTSMWQPEQQVLVQTLPWTLASDEFVLTVGVYVGEDGWDAGNRLAAASVDPALPTLEEGTLVRLGGYQAASPSSWQPVDPAGSAPQRALDATFPGGLALKGTTVPETVQPDGMLDVRLYWRADTTPMADYSVFVQLLAADERKIAQWDGPPYDAASKVPASSWPAGWHGEHRVALAVPTGLPAGDYRIIAGMYHWQTGERLPVFGVDAGAADAVHLGTVHVP